MAVVLKLLSCKPGLSSGTLGVTSDLMSTSSATKGWLIKNICFYCPAGTLTVDLKVRQGAGGTARMVAKGISVTGGTTPTILEREITLDLNTPEILSAFVTATIGTLDVVINGVERDQ
jgi:hypothetical protein